MYRSSFDSDSRPLGEFRGFPVYLATLLTAAHVLSLLPAAIAGFGAWAQWLFFRATPTPDPQVWRWVTYPFVHREGLWFLVDMILLYFWGKKIEQAFGRKVFSLLYICLVLAPPLITQLLASTAGISSPLAGTRLAHFPLFLAFCFMEPTAPFFFPHPALQAKYVGTVFFLFLLLGFLGDRMTGLLIAFIFNCGLTYFILRKNGLPARFAAISNAFSAALPQRSKPRNAPRPAAARSPSSSAASAKSSGSSGSAYYEPKIKPKPDLYPEKQAVQEVDALLDKIARSGLDSLTPAERATLQRASARLKNPD